MSTGGRSIFFVTVGLLSLIAHPIIRIGPVSLLPAPILLAIVVTWLVPRPWFWLSVLAVGTEVLSTLPPGIATAICLLPWVLWRLRGRLTIDLAFLPWLWLLLTVTLQLAVGLLPVLHSTTPELSFRSAQMLLPWGSLALATIISGSTALFLIVIYSQLFPEQQRIVTLDTSRIHG